MYLANKTGDENRKAFIFKKETCPRLLDGGLVEGDDDDDDGDVQDNVIGLILIKTVQLHEHTQVQQRRAKKKKKSPQDANN